MKDVDARTGFDRRSLELQGAPEVKRKREGQSAYIFPQEKLKF
jgi:hypothetical protein